MSSSRRHRCARRHRCEADIDSGFTLVATLSAVVLLIVLATIAFSVTLGDSPTTTTVAGQTTTTIPRNTASASTAVYVAACEADYSIVATAVNTYRALNGSPPPPGTSWATSSASGPLLQTWPSNPKSFTITWNGKVVGVLPKRGVASHGSFGTSTPATGCYNA